MKNKNKVISSIIAIVLILLVIGLSIYSLISQYGKTPNFPTFVVTYSSTILSCIVGFIYIIKGSSKSEFMWFKAFIAIQGICHLTSILRTSFVGSSKITQILDAIIFGLLCTLFFSENFGKTKSFIFSWIIIVLDIICILILNIGVLRLGRIINTLAIMLMDVILILLINQKYIDKQERFTK